VGVLKRFKDNKKGGFRGGEISFVSTGKIKK